MTDNLNSQLEAIKKHPILFSALALGWVSSASISMYMETKLNDSGVTEMIIDAKRREIEAQTKLEAMREAEISDVQEFMESLVDTYDTAAWVKYLDYGDQKFDFIATNQIYSDIYGTPVFPRGKSDVELYEKVELSPIERANILEYAANDRKAARLGTGRCLVVYEYAYPVDRKPDENKKYKFKKCMLKHATSTYVLGYQL